METNTIETSTTESTPAAKVSKPKAQKKLFDIPNQGRGMRYSPAQKKHVMNMLRKGTIRPATKSKPAVFERGLHTQILQECGVTYLRQLVWAKELETSAPKASKNGEAIAQ